MARHARIIYQAADYHGGLWDVREERDTPNGWKVLLGWPAGVPRGRGGSGGSQIVITRELKAYFDDLRYDPGFIDLPIGAHSIKHIRHTLGYNWYDDRPLWWSDRAQDLKTMTLNQFCKKHGCSTGAASQARNRLA